MIYLLSCNPKIKQFNTMEKHTQGFDDCQINDHHCKYEKLISDVVDWADDKGLVKEENSDKQLIKIIEEVGELASAILKKKRKEEYNVKFSKEEIEKIHGKFMQQMVNRDLFNLEHDQSKTVPAYVLELLPCDCIEEVRALRVERDLEVCELACLSDHAHHAYVSDSYRQGLHS